jgi:pimeloyl-ACP methyl ester carboxylesterase
VASQFRWVICALAWSFLLGGCGSSYKQLVSEHSIPDLREAARATIDGGNRTLVTTTHGADGQSVRLAIHELDSPATDRILVLIHGVMADHTTWRFVAGDLARDHGVWIVDLPGCGQSDAPRPSGPDSYSAADMTERTLESLRNLLSSRPAETRLSLVGHSYGGTLIATMFGNDSLRTRYADVLDRVDRLVLISPFDVAMNRPTSVFQELAEASSLKVSLASSTGILKERVAKATLASVTDPSRALKEEADKRIEFLEDSAKRVALQETLKKAVPWTKDLRPDWDRIEPLEAAYAKVDRECLVIVGLRDEALPASMAFKLASEMPRAMIIPMQKVMHSPHIEAHEKCAAMIRSFVTTGRVDGEGIRIRDHALVH